MTCQEFEKTLDELYDLSNKWKDDDNWFPPTEEAIEYAKGFWDFIDQDSASYSIMSTNDGGVMIVWNNAFIKIPSEGDDFKIWIGE